MDRRSRIHADSLVGWVALVSEERLSGDLALWLVVLLELATFGLGFVAFAAMRGAQPVLFAAGQARLDAGAGAVNTALLIAGSWACARGVAAGPQQARRWLMGAVAAGLGFMALKGGEYARQAPHLDVEASAFDALYVGLTGFHFLHVLAATVVLGILAVLGRRVSLHALETGALLWHLVDLLWLVLFALVYLWR